ncbi:hypothetical protein MCM1_2376 [Methanosarcina barkeri CM1]|uniref:Uncharacterized protein n=1 Tax=Methanosarcina barkeri CM1 TaxID=796385 RepID=A0A0G3CHJ3_METBA|nr:hypothetical protein MCM1_2376 [Methanosarcina barkeri CM1]
MFFLFFYIIIKLDIFLCFKDIFCSLSDNIFCSSNLILLYFDLTYLIFTILFYISISFFISLLIRKTSRPASTSLIISCLTVSLFKKSLSEKPINEVVSLITSLFKKGLSEKPINEVVSLITSLFKKGLSEKPINEVVSVIKWLNG